ncbi:MAG: hypothetical protein WAV21_01535 [Minisyncoccia bacterium]
MTENEKNGPIVLQSDGTRASLQGSAPPRRVIRTYASDIAALTQGGHAPQGVAQQTPVFAPPKPAPRSEPHLPPLTPKAPVETLRPVTRPTPPPIQTAAVQKSDWLAEASWEPPQKTARPMYSVDQELQTSSPVPQRSFTPVPTIQPRQSSGPSWFTRLLISLFGSRKPAPEEGKILSSRIVTPAVRPLPAPEPVPQPMPAVAVPPPAPQPQQETITASAQDEREAILERLRARIASRTESTPAPAFPTAKPEPEVRAEPPRPPTLPPENLPGAPKATPAPERLHTYTSDFSNEIDTKRASTFSVLAAQADAGGLPESATAANPNRGLLYALLTTILVVGGSTGLYFAYRYASNNAPVSLTPSSVSSLISADDKTSIEGTGVNLLNAFHDAAEVSLPEGSVRVIYLSIATTTLTGETHILKPGGALVAALHLPAPDILLRNIGEESTVGVVHAGGENRAFFILRANSYERTFAGMLSWEATIGQDLSFLYPPYAELSVETPVATSTSAATTPKSTVAKLPPGFVDEIVANHDVRALKDGNGLTLLLYGYKDQKTLIIARDEAAFTTLLNRLSATREQ